MHFLQLLCTLGMSVTGILTGAPSSCWAGGEGTMKLSIRSHPEKMSENIGLGL